MLAHGATPEATSRQLQADMRKDGPHAGGSLIGMHTLTVRDGHSKSETHISLLTFAVSPNIQIVTPDSTAEVVIWRHPTACPR